MNRIPDTINKFKAATWVNLNFLSDKLDFVIERLNTIERDNRAYRHTQEVLSVKISQYLPMDCMKDMELFFMVSYQVKDFVSIN